MWKTLNELPEVGDTVVVAAWEFGGKPIIYLAQFWQSCLPDQPPKFYLHPSYRPDCPVGIPGVRLWHSVAHLTHATPDGASCAPNEHEFINNSFYCSKCGDPLF